MKIKLSKKIIVFIILTLVLLAVGRILKVKGYISKDFFYQTLVKIHIIKPCYNAHKNMLEIYNQEGFDYEKENERVIKDSLIKLADKSEIDSITTKIPLITHRIYLVNETSPPKLNDFYIELMKANSNKLNDLGVDWEHNIWTNYPDMFKEVEDTKSVHIRNIAELKDNILYESLLEIIKNGQEKKPYLAEGADLARIIIVEKFGGIYMDMDYEIYNPLEMLKLMKKFDFFAGREVPSQHSQYGNAFFASKANHQIMIEALRRAYRNRINKSEAPTYIKYPCSGYDELYFNGPPLITMSYFSQNNIEGNNDVILPPWMIFNLNYARYKNGIYHSKQEEVKLDNWFVKKIKKLFRVGTPKFSDPVCDYSLITKEDFQINDKKIKQLMLQLTDNITMDDLEKYFKLKNGDREFLVYEDNIFYNLKTRKEYPIIGADMFCGSWTEGGKVFKRKYYWRFLNES